MYDLYITMALKTERFLFTSSQLWGQATSCLKVITMP